MHCSSVTLWNYTADNTNEHGDGWNDEDLSIFSRDQQTGPKDVNSGGRALPALVRPYARATAGAPLRMRFNLRTRRFEFAFRHDPQVDAPTEIFVPRYQYPRGFTATASDGTFEEKPDEQLLLYRHTKDRAVHTVRIQPKR